jgi:hypothetical protein
MHIRRERRAGSKLIPPLSAPAAGEERVQEKRDFAGIIEIAMDAFEDREKAIQWLGDANVQTGGSLRPV